jgi:mannose-6-phosphate isomerase-like protein (cupin superfamily)
MKTVKTFEIAEIPNPYFISVCPLHVGEETILLAADMLVEMPPETPHRLVNDGSSRLRMLNIKAPRPNKSTHIVTKYKEN